VATVLTGFSHSRQANRPVDSAESGQAKGAGRVDGIGA
jgi:hypothetical protein